MDIDDVTYFEERERKRHERQLLTEQEDQQELAKFEISFVNFSTPRFLTSFLFSFTAHKWRR